MSLLFSRIEEILVGSSLGCIALFSFVQVVLRYLFGTSLGWMEEILRYIMVLMTIFGASLGVKKASHFNVDILLSRANDRIRIWLLAANNLISAAFVTVLTVAGYRLMLYALDFGQIMPATGMPKYIPYMIIPIGGIFIVSRFFLEALSCIRKALRSHS